MFSQQLYNEETRAIINIAGREIPGIVTRDEIEEIMSNPPSLSKSDYPYLEERKELMGVYDNGIQSKSTSNMTGTIENRRAQYIQNLPQQQAELYALQQTPSNTAGTTSEEIQYPQYIGTGAFSEMLHDRSRMQKGRINSIVDLLEAESAQHALGRMMDSWKYRNAPKISKQDAESYYKSLGLDLKEKDSGISEYEMVKKAETAIKKQELEANLALFNNTNDITFLNRAEILGTSLITGMFSTPLDTVVTAASFALPELAVGTVSNIGKGLSSTYKTERVLNAMSRLRTAKNIATTVDVATSATKEGAATRSIYMATKARLMDPKLIKSVESIENMKNLNYASLSANTKTGLDALTWVGLDLPQVMIRSYDSKETEIYQYTGKDAITELLLAGSLGVALPGSLRFIGGKLGIRPFEMTTRQLNELENSIKASVARGEILPSEAKVQLAEVGKLKENLSVIQGSFKKPHPDIQNAVDGLEQANVSSDIVRARVQKVMELMKAGVPVSAWELPERGSIFSSINAKVLNGLIDDTQNVADVFGKNLVFKKLDNGLIEASVIGERGLLGKVPLVGRSEEELIEQMGNMYKGFVLENPDSETSKSLARFMDWVKKDRVFAEELEDILSDYRAAFNENKEGGGRLNAKDLKELRIKDRLEEAYIRYRLGDSGFLAYEDASYQNLFMDATGQEVSSALTPEMVAAEKEAAEFSSKWLKEYKKNTGVYDFLSAEGKDDKGAEFNRYVNSLKKASDNNIELANSENVFKSMDEARIKNWLEKIENLQVSEDTDLNRLFGTPRSNYDELQQLATDTSAWNDVLARKKIEVESISSSPEMKESIQLLTKHATAEDSAGAVYSRAKGIISTADSLKETGFVDIKNNFFDILRNDPKYEKLSGHIEDYANGGKPSAFIKESIKEALSTSFQKTRLGVFLPEDIRAEIVNKTYKYMLREIRENPEILKSLYNLEKAMEEFPELKRTSLEVEEAKTAFKETVKTYKEARSEKVKEIRKGRENEKAWKELSDIDEKYSKEVGEKRELAAGGEEELAKKNAIVAEFQANMETFFNPMAQVIDTELTRLQIQKLNDIDIMQARFHLMVEHPELAAEIITAGSTQTVYDFMGSRRNLEYIRRSAGLYEKDVYYTLAKMDSEDGTTLAKYFANKDNREDIEKAIINLKHGTGEHLNSDASRIAQVILDEQSTLYSDFSRYGSSYNKPMNLINRSQLKYADSIIPEAEVEKLTKATDIESTLSISDLTDSMLAEDGIRYGNKITPLEKGEADIKATMQDIQSILDSFFTVENKARKKVGLWALKSFDLDEMFDKKGRSALGFNVIRDAVLSGKIKELVDGDYLNLYYLKKDLTMLRNKIIGDVPGEAGTGSWVDNFYNGFQDFGGVMDGRKSAYLDAFENNIVFKDANAEIEATTMFGYDTMQKMMVSNFDAALKAQYSLEIFGSDPLGIAHDLMNAFEKARSHDAKFKDKLKALADKNGVELSKYQIRKDQRDSVDRYIKYACGMREQAPTDGVRVMQALRSLCSFSLLAKAGLKSFSDWGTIGENLIANGLVDRGEALKTMTRTVTFFNQHPELHHHLTAAAVVETEDLASFTLNDPTITMSRLSDNVTWVDKLESFSHKASTGFLDYFAHVADITNSNKKVAARTLQHSIGLHKDKSYADLKKMSYMLENEGIDEVTWDLMRKHMTKDLNKDYEGPAYWYFDPFSASEISDNVIEEAMRKQGRTNLSKTAIDSYRRNLQSKGFTLINSSADEFISMPSERTMSQLRFNNVKGSWAAFWAETVTQYQAFPCAMAYNTYGREIAHAVKGQTGITAIDMFNPFNKVSWAAKAELYNNIFKSAFSIGMSMLLVDSLVDAAAGRIEAPVKEDGSLNIDLILRRATAPMGPLGIIMDTMYNAIDASGQRGGGISVQMAPAASNVVRTLYRNKKILTSDRIPDKAPALGAEFANELGRSTGLKTLPFVAPVYQMIIGSYLDMLEQGGEANWNRTLQFKEQRGTVIMPWDERPQPFNPALFEGL